MTLVMLALDEELVDHLRVACRAYHNRASWTIPASFGEFEAMLGAVRSGQEGSGRGAAVAVSHDGLDDLRDGYLTPTEAAQIARVSASTMGRWLRNRWLPAESHGRTRRIARTDLDEFLRGR